jgi:hypothetical protein
VPDPPRSRRTLFIVLGGAAVLGIVIAIAVGAGGSRPAAPDAALAVVVDAAPKPEPVVVPDAAEVVIAIDAAPIDPNSDLEKITTECKTEIANKDWGKLNDCGKRLTKAGGNGQEFVDRSIDESKAEAAARNLKVRVKRDFKEATRLFATIATSSVYYAEAKNVYDSMYVDLVQSTVADLNALARDCTRYNAKAKGVENLYGKQISDEARAKAKTCSGDAGDPPRKPCDGACKADERCENNKCVAKTVALAPNPCLDTQFVADTENKADAAMMAGSYAQALASYEQILRCKPHLQTKTFMAACKGRNFSKAKIYFQGLKTNLAQICIAQGFDPR